MNIEIKGFSEQNNGIKEFPQQNKETCRILEKKVHQCLKIVFTIQVCTQTNTNFNKSTFYFHGSLISASLDCIHKQI